MEDGPKLTPEELLRANNEIEALKLDMEMGGHSFISDDAKAFGLLMNAALRPA